jgi:NhaA family Na+:H+ antiporter
MLVPAGLYVAVNLLAPDGTLDGWAVPMATDIAFALAVLAVVGRSLPNSLRAFLLTLAVVDDLGAIAVIAVSSPATSTSWRWAWPSPASSPTPCCSSGT